MKNIALLFLVILLTSCVTTSRYQCCELISTDGCVNTYKSCTGFGTIEEAVADCEMKNFKED